MPQEAIYPREDQPPQLGEVPLILEPLSFGAVNPLKTPTFPRLEGRRGNTKSETLPRQGGRYTVPDFGHPHQGLIARRGCPSPSPEEPPIPGEPPSPEEPSVPEEPPSSEGPPSARGPPPREEPPSPRGSPLPKNPRHWKDPYVTGRRRSRGRLNRHWSPRTPMYAESRFPDHLGLTLACLPDPYT